MQADDLKMLLKGDKAVLDVTANVIGYVVTVSSKSAARRLSARMSRYRGMSVSFQAAPLLFLGAPVRERTYDTGVTYTATQGIFRLLVYKTVGERYWSATLFIYDASFQLRRKKRDLRMSVVSVERVAKAHVRAAKRSLRPSPDKPAR
jgi:hypothetical protein